MIEQDGRISKFVDQAESITYRVRDGVRDRGQTARIVTERAVFDVTSEGLVLTEVAPGVDVRAHILDRMSYAPARIAEPLAKMDGALFISEQSKAGETV